VTIGLAVLLALIAVAVFVPAATRPALVLQAAGQSIGPG
jgi:hypothetical protein